MQRRPVEMHSAIYKRNHKLIYIIMGEKQNDDARLIQVIIEYEIHAHAHTHTHT